MNADAIVAAADAMEQWLRREDPDVCRLMFRSSIEAMAEAAAPILVAAGRRQAADDLEQFAETPEVKQRLGLGEYNALRYLGPYLLRGQLDMFTGDACFAAARIAEGAPAEPVEEGTE